MFRDYISSMLCVASISISKWWQLPCWRQINLFPAPVGNSVPLGLNWAREGRCKSRLNQCPTMGNDLAVLTCCGCREDEMACRSHGVQSCLRLGGGTEWGLQKAGGNSLLLSSGISVQKGPGRKDLREPGGQLSIGHLLFLAFFFSLLSFTLAVR